MITLLELRDKLLEYINAVELQKQLLISSIQLLIGAIKNLLFTL